MISCSKDNEDARDKFLGTFSVEQRCVRDGSQVLNATYSDIIQVRGDNPQRLNFKFY